MIPKIIHYCWLSGDPVPKDYQKRMKSWNKIIPDYEFILWDTKRFDVNSSPWTKQAFEAKHYASAADYIRLYAVYHYGGIYLDMDVEVVKPFDDLLNTGLFLAKENHVQDYIEAGCFGAEKGHPFIKMCLDWFDSHAFTGVGQIILPQIMYAIWKESFDRTEYRLYSRDYFTAKNIITGRIEKTKNTYTIHHFATKWIINTDRLERSIGWKIYAIFGENKFSEFLFEGVKKIRTVLSRIKKYGFSSAMRYYFSKYIIRKNNQGA